MAVKSDDRSRGVGKLPPTPPKTLLGVGGNLLVLSSDAQLIDTVHRASQGQMPVDVAASWSELETAMATTRRAVVVLDVAVLGRELNARVTALGAYSHKIVTLLAAERSTAEGVMGLLSEGKVHRLLIKPAALGITRLLIESAVNRCLKLSEATTTEWPPQEAPAPPHAAEGKRGTMPVWLLASAAAALFVGVAIVVGVTAAWHPDVASTVAVTDASGDAPDAELQRAAVAGSIAMVRDDATNETSRPSVEPVVSALLAQAEEALLADDLRGAEAALSELRRADPANSRLAFLEAQLERARPARRRTEPPQPMANAELVSLLTIARARIQRGQLLEPAGDGAREYLDRAETLAPNDASVAAVRTELAAALVAAARAALAAGNVDAASAATAAARRSGAERAELARVNAEIAELSLVRAQRRQASWLDSAERRLSSGDLFAPDGDSAHYFLQRLQQEAPRSAGLEPAWTRLRAAATARAAAALAARDWVAAESVLTSLRNVPQGENVAAPLLASLERSRLQEHYLAAAAPASELTLIDRVAPVYPQEAAQRGIEGWVDLEFVVDAEGKPTALSVVAAEPLGRFEDAALRAIREYRYQPFERDGQVFERRIGLRMRFALE